MTSTLGIFLLIAVAALAHASLPSDTQEAAQAALTPSRIELEAKKWKPLCWECEKFLGLLKKVINNPSLEPHLIKALKAICDFKLNPFKTKCTNLANDIIIVLREMQGTLYDPNWDCEMLKFCNKEEPSPASASKMFMLAVASKVVQDVHRPSPINEIATCGLCQSAVNEVKRFLEVPEFQQKVVNFVAKICKHGFYPSRCNEIIQNNFPQLIQLILDNVLCNPEQVCSAIRLCHKTQTNTFATFKDRVLALRPLNRLDQVMANVSKMESFGINVKCLTCKASVALALTALNTNKMVTTITTDLTKVVCKALPTTLQAGCLDFLGIYAKPALILLLNEWTPADICTEVHACNAAFLQQIEQLSVIEKSVIECDACKTLSRVLAYELQQPAFQQDIISVLTRGCKLIPGEIGNKCGDLMIEFVPAGLSYVADFLTREDACSVLRMC